MTRTTIRRQNTKTVPKKSLTTRTMPVSSPIQLVLVLLLSLSVVYCPAQFDPVRCLKMDARTEAQNRFSGSISDRIGGCQYWRVALAGCPPAAAQHRRAGGCRRRDAGLQIAQLRLPVLCAAVCFPLCALSISLLPPHTHTHRSTGAISPPSRSLLFSLFCRSALWHLGRRACTHADYLVFSAVVRRWRERRGRVQE